MHCLMRAQPLSYQTGLCAIEHCCHAEQGLKQGLEHEQGVKSKTHGGVLESLPQTIPDLSGISRNRSNNVGQKWRYCQLHLICGRWLQKITAWHMPFDLCAACCGLCHSQLQLLGNIAAWGRLLLPLNGGSQRSCGVGLRLFGSNFILNCHGDSV